ncbi:MAG: rod shape-determining protein [bacterium]|nr:rod shape-determining protein [bacterium]
MDIAIDLGSTRTRVFIPDKGKIIDEATVAAIDLEKEEIIAVGDKAYKMLGKTPSKIEAMYLLENGVIAESRMVEDMLKIALQNTSTGKIVKPRAVVAVPGGITEVEKHAVINVVSNIGVRQIYLIKASKAAILGCGIDVMSPRGKLIADFGGGCAEASVVSLGGASVSKRTNKAGRKMDEEIMKFARKKYSLIIGENMAESCKKEIGSLVPLPEEKNFRLKGRDAVGGLPKFVDVTSEEIREVLTDIAEGMVNIIKNALEETPPELMADIYTDGIIFTGGLANIYGFSRLIAKSTNIKVRVAENPQDCVIKGCAKAVGYINSMEKSSGRETSPLVKVY